MCQIFAGQDPQNYAFETRSIRLMGHSTSIRLESKFWVVLEEISADQNMTMARFLSKLHEEAEAIHGKISNFASLLRCCCLNYLDASFDRERMMLESTQATQATQAA